MKMLGESVLIAFPDGLGAGPRIASALGASSLIRTVTDISLSLERYGVCENIPLEVVNFTKQGKTLVSLITVVKEPAPGLHSCVAYELLQYVLQNAPTEDPTFTMFVPAAVPCANGKPVPAYKITFNDEVKARETMFSNLELPPANLHIRDEFLACLMHLSQVVGFPAVFLLIPVHRVNRLDKRLVTEEKASSFKAICTVGALVAQWLGLGFSSDKIDEDIPEKLITSTSKGSEWSGLYT